MGGIITASINLNIKKSVFNEVYYPYLMEYGKRYEVYYGGSGSGKSIFCSQKLVVKALRSRRKILVIRKVDRTLLESVYRDITNCLKSWEIWKYCKANLTTLTIELPNGSIFLFKGLSDSERIKSISGITDIWVEEATELTLDDYTQLDLRLRALEPDLQLIASFNPVSRVNWVFKKWFEDGAAYDKENTFILKTTYKDNKFLPQSYIDALLEKMNSNPTYYRIYALGEFASLDKLVFNNWKIESFDYSTIKGDLLVGLDFGFVNDISALVASVLDEENKKIYIFREWGETNKTNNELAEIIAAMGFSKSVIVADAAEQKSIEEIKRSGISRIKPCVKGADSILHGIQKLQQYEIIVNPNCGGIITELENYSWQKDKKSNEYINKPIDCFNHYIDALRYSLQCVNNNKLKTISKAAFSL